MPEYRPSPEQEAILRHDPRRHARVMAGPGTGKSATLIALVIKLLERRDAPRIRLLTFTRAATGELAKKVSEHPNAIAERPSTIHSFAISVLVRNPGAVDLPMPIRIADSWEYGTIVRPTLARRMGVRVRRLDNLVQEMSANWESLRDEAIAGVDPAERARFHGAWGEHRRTFGYTLLAELPFALRMALQNHPDLRGVDYGLLVVDEYQDLNACDLEVIRFMADRGCAVMAGGDDDQSIYSFRKADPQGIRRFPDDFAEAANYPLTVTRRCGRRIIEWANYVIEGDPDRPHKAPLTPAPDSPEGDVALLAFADGTREATGIASLVRKLVDAEQVPAPEILILLRTDYNEMFSSPIKAELLRAGVPFSDPGTVDRVLAEPPNRWALATFRLRAHVEDSLAWATLLILSKGIGWGFLTYVSDASRERGVRFGEGLLRMHQEGFPAANRTQANRATVLIGSILGWLAEHPLPQVDQPKWGEWIIENAGGNVVPALDGSLASLLQKVDRVVEPGLDLGRYLGQVVPLGRDQAANESAGVRIMTMAAAKGLTVQAAIIAALEEGVVPRPDGILGEERRLLYVGMTRARRFLYATWARRRTGPTARAGQGRVRERRTHTTFFNGGPVQSQDGLEFLRDH